MLFTSCGSLERTSFRSRYESCANRFLLSERISRTEPRRTVGVEEAFRREEHMDESLIEQRVVAGYELTRLTPSEFLEAVFDGCGNQNLIGIGSVRSGRRKAKPFLHYLTPLAVEDRGAMFFEIVEASKPAPTFLCYNTFAPASCAITKTGKKVVWKGPGSEVFFSATKEQVEELNAIIIDLDVGRDAAKTPKPGATLNDEEALTIALDRCRADRLPVPTVVVFSGRGLQLVYLLRDQIADEMNDAGEWIIGANEARRRPVPRTTQHEQEWKQIADDIVKKRLADLAPDRKASKTTCNWFRVPGTTNEKSGREVTAWRISDSVRYYALDELSSELLRTAVEEDHRLLFTDAKDAYGNAHSKKRLDDDVERRRRTATPQQVAHPSVVRKIELEKINRHRGGMGPGYRHNFIYHYRSAVYRAHQYEHGHLEAKKAAWERVAKIAATFAQPNDDPFTDEQLAAACRANPWQPASNETVADDLDVTAEEVELLDLKSIVPKEIAEERVLNYKNAQRQKRVKREERDLTVKVLLRAGRSYTRIERLTGVTRSTIRNINDRYKQTGELLVSDSPLKDQEGHLVAQIEEHFGINTRRGLAGSIPA
jgi:hypothetical protein